MLDYVLQYPTVDGDRDDLSGYINIDMQCNSLKTKSRFWSEPHLKSPIGSIICTSANLLNVLFTLN